MAMVVCESGESGVVAEVVRCWNSSDTRPLTKPFAMPERVANDDSAPAIDVLVSDDSVADEARQSLLTFNPRPRRRRWGIRRADLPRGQRWKQRLPEVCR